MLHDLAERNKHLLHCRTGSRRTGMKKKVGMAGMAQIVKIVKKREINSKIATCLGFMERSLTSTSLNMLPAEITIVEIPFC